jgi:hypothetical protein
MCKVPLAEAHSNILWVKADLSTEKKSSIGQVKLHISCGHNVEYCVLSPVGNPGASGDPSTHSLAY